jgi:hypothetical protein
MKKSERVGHDDYLMELAKEGLGIVINLAGSNFPAGHFVLSSLGFFNVRKSLCMELSLLISYLVSPLSE